MSFPKQLFITLKMVNGQEDFPLGFLHEHAPDKKSDVKKKQTQMNWAYGNYKQEEGVLVKIYGALENGEYIRKEVVVEECVRPKVWENNPLTGFKILTFVSRYSTSNKVWRVLDPRGVVFEISTAVFADIVANSTIINGVIQEPCLWEGNKNLKVWKNAD